MSNDNTDEMKVEYDFSNAKRATQIPHLNRLRQQKILDDDVAFWLASQDSSVKERINQMIRQVMAIQQVAY